MNTTITKPICERTGKMMLSQREAGNIISGAKKSYGSKIIPKSFYTCPCCGNYHLTHFSKTNKEFGKKETREMLAYKRSPKLRVADYY